MNGFCYLVLSRHLQVLLAPPVEVGRLWLWERTPCSGGLSEILRKLSAWDISGEEWSMLQKAGRQLQVGFSIQPSPKALRKRQVKWIIMENYGCFWADTWMPKLTCMLLLSSWQIWSWGTSNYWYSLSYKYVLLSQNKLWCTMGENQLKAFHFCIAKTNWGPKAAVVLCF